MNLPNERTTKTKTRWPRSQRFQLSPNGREAGTTYRELIAASRAEGARLSFESARTAWAKELTLDPTDGLYLEELHAGPRTIEELATALDGCGPSRADVKEAVDRLVNVRIIEPVEPPPPPPPRPLGNRW